MKNIPRTLIIAFLWLLNYVSNGALPCVSMDGWMDGKQGSVCICNATYCDTVDPVSPVAKGQYLLYTSSQEGLRFNMSTGDFQKDRPDIPGVFFTINTEEKYQKIIGFGGAFTDAAGINIRSLSKESQDNLMKSYFSNSGIEYNIGRIPIGGTDFSTRPYTLDDGSEDPQLLNFTLTEEDYKYKIPFITRAKELSGEDIWLLGSAWSAPAWMKTNNALTGIGVLKEKYYDTWAEYHLKFLDGYSNENITLWGLTTGNEPLDGIIPWIPINSMGWTPMAQRKWIKENLGPNLKNSKHNKTLIIIHDDQRLLFPWWISEVLSDPEVANYVSGMGLHWYIDFLVPVWFVAKAHENAPDKFILYTEACSGSYPWDRGIALGSWNRGQDYMQSIIENVNNWATGWMDWNIALNLQGGPFWTNGAVDSPIIVDSTKDEFYKQPMYYAMGHFSKFVKRGSVRLGVDPQNKDNIEILAVQNNDGGVAVVLLNKGTDENVVTVYNNGTGYAQITVPAKSFNTLLYW